MKRLIPLIIILIISTTSCYKAPKYDYTIYITDTGEKYHDEHCRYLRNSKKETKLSKALYKKYKACKVCNPPTKDDLDKLNEQGEE